jgi:hypothetical protein
MTGLDFQLTTALSDCTTGELTEQALAHLSARDANEPEWPDYGESLAPGIPSDGCTTGENRESQDVELSNPSDRVYLQYPK